MQKIISLLLAVLTIINGGMGVTITDENIQEYLPSDYASVAEFIVENLTVFAGEYNKQIEDEGDAFEATSCEFTAPIYVHTFDQEGLYLDFNDDNGYMIVVNDYTVVAFETKGDYSYLRGQDYLHYSVYDGFLYDDGTGNFIPYYYQQMTEEDCEEYSKTVLESYSGQSKGKDGTIYDPYAFVKDKYGSGYSVYQQKSLSSYQYVSQYDLSIYYEKKNNSTYSEGNCSLASIYSLMNYLRTSGKYKNLPSGSKVYSATKDSFYKKYSKKSNYTIEKNKRLPILYYEIREYAKDHYGYEVNGTNPFNIETIIEKVGREYNCNINANHILIWSYEKQVVKEIDAGYPTIWNMANSSSYGSHTTVVTGYKTYRKTTSVFGIKIYSYVKLLQLNDNWRTSARYFDFTNYNAFGSFVKVR